jgi:LysM repeat protein
LARVGSFLPGDHRPKVGDTRPRRRTGEPAAPPWERQHHRYDAYPTLKTRIGLPALPRVGVLAVAVLLAAAGLFMLPTLLGIGNPSGTSAPSGSPGRTAAASASVGPTIPAAPTPQTYEVQPGDTMSRIATRFGVPLADLIAANREQHPDPNRLAVGDLLIIPAPAPSSFTDPGAGSAAPAAT